MRLVLPRTAVIKCNLISNTLFNEFSLIPPGIGPDSYDVFNVTGPDGKPINVDGCLFWEASRDVRGKVALLKYNWIEKTITATAITLGYFAGDIPARLMFLIILTNWLWIPFIV